MGYIYAILNYDCGCSHEAGAHPPLIVDCNMEDLDEIKRFGKICSAEYQCKGAPYNTLMIVDDILKIDGEFTIISFEKFKEYIKAFEEYHKKTEEWVAKDYEGLAPDCPQLYLIRQKCNGGGYEDNLIDFSKLTWTREGGYDEKQGEK